MNHKPITLDTAARMLSYVRGVETREVWVKLAYVLKEEYGDEAFDAWDTWSAGASNYVESDTRAVWRSIKPGSGSTRASIGALVALAKEGGWAPTEADHKPHDPAEAARLAEQRAQRIAHDGAQRAQQAQQAATDAERMWAQALPNQEHPYLTAKGIKGVGARVLDGVLLVPVKRSPAELVGLQRITADGTKRFLPGTPMAGAYTSIGKPGPCYVIAEGYATAGAIHEATGYPVVIAYSAGNLAAVAKKIAQRYPDAAIIIAADDDSWTDGNPGLTAANKAAAAIGATVAVPRWFGDRADGRTDFCDLSQDEGAAAVRECIGAASGPDPVYTGPTAAGSVKLGSDAVKNNASSGVTVSSLAGGLAVLPGGDGNPAPVRPDVTDVAKATKPAGATERLMIFAGSPMRTAYLFCDTLPSDGRVIFWRGDFYAWDGCRYAVRDRVYIEQLVYHFMEGCDTQRVNPRSGDVEVVACNPKTSTVNDVIHALRAVCYQDIPEPQCWIDAQPGDPPAGEIIAFANGFLHWPTRTLHPSTPRLFVISALDFGYDPQAGQPTNWLQFLAGIWAEDAESTSVLAEMFGYLLTDDTSLQKMFLLIGPPRSGKGTILRVLESLVGYNNRVSPSLASIGTQFGLQPLIGKRVAMISDARLSGKTDQQPIVENLLRISGEDALSIDRKNITAWTGKLSTRFILASNELPAFSDASAALANRFILLRFTRSFLGTEDAGLTKKLLTELPKIVLWALDGLVRLRERGHLVNPQSASDLAADLVDQTSPVRSFVAEMCIIGDGNSCLKDDMFSTWATWCKNQGRDHAGTKISFGRQLSAAYPLLKSTQPRAGGGRKRSHIGIGLRGDWEFGDDAF